MPRLRKRSLSLPSTTNSQPPAPIPPAEYIKRELATFYPHKKDQRALAASSSAIALSIISASCYPKENEPNEPGSSKESTWKTTYGAARIAIETAKESSDMFPPLKAVVGALSVLIKNYDASPS